MTKKLIQYTSYYTFIQRLQYKCEQNKIGFIIKDEAYTSKTCTRCSNKYDIGSDKIYKCKNNKCKLIIDRDLTGARNIMMLY